MLVSYWHYYRVFGITSCGFLCNGMELRCYGGDELVPEVCRIVVSISEYTPCWGIYCWSLSSFFCCLGFIHPHDVSTNSLFLLFKLFFAIRVDLIITSPVWPALNVVGFGKILRPVFWVWINFKIFLWVYDNSKLDLKVYLRLFRLELAVFFLQKSLFGCVPVQPTFWPGLIFYMHVELGV